MHASSSAQWAGQIGDGLMSEAELDAAVAECEKIASDPSAAVITFTVTQTFGRKPAVN